MQHGVVYCVLHDDVGLKITSHSRVLERVGWAFRFRKNGHTSVSEKPSSQESSCTVELWTDGCQTSTRVVLSCSNGSITPDSLQIIFDKRRHVEVYWTIGNWHKIRKCFDLFLFLHAKVLKVICDILPPSLSLFTTIVRIVSEYWGLPCRASPSALSLSRWL
jgi:hypothetical protein